MTSHRLIKELDAGTNQRLPSAKPPSHDGCTLEEVAAELGVTVGRARQIEMQALRKLRFFCRRCGWDYHLLMGD